jgi:hypothetical protein
VNKIIKINSDISDELRESIVQDFMEIACAESTKLDVFEQATEKEIRDVIQSSSNATCELDTIPTALLKNCSAELVPSLIQLVNMSLSQGSVPTSMKSAVVRPLLKKPSLDKNEFKNFRPVSNLSFISKLTEKIVAKHINAYLDLNSLRDPAQSAYRRFHSCETVLLKVQNDLMSAMHEKKMAALVLLDLSAAFDTINHTILINRLSIRFGITGTVLDWISSYLSNRSQFVVIGQNKSASEPLQTGVPQGSILGPILFTLYISPVSDITRRHGLGHQCYADDTQLYITFKTANKSSAIKIIENCAADI